MSKQNKNDLRECFHSFKHVINLANVLFFFFISLQTCSYSLNNVNSLNCSNDINSLHAIPSVLLTAFFKFRSFRSSHKFIAKQIFIWLYENISNHPWRRVFRNANLRIHWRLLTILKPSKKMYEVICLLCKKMYILKVYSNYNTWR